MIKNLFSVIKLDKNGMIFNQEKEKHILFWNYKIINKKTENNNYIYSINNLPTYSINNFDKKKVKFRRKLNIALL